MIPCKDRSNFVCTKCKLVSILEEKVQGLEKQVSTLRCIRENEDFLDRCQDMLLQAQRSEESEQVVQSGLRESEENWQHVTSRRRKRSVHVPAMQIQKSQTLQDIVAQPADTPAISILKNRYTKITVTLKKMFPASGERKSPDRKIGSDPGKSEERQEISQSSAVTLKKMFPASGERKSPDWKMEELFKGRKTLKVDIRSSQVKRTSLFHLKLKGVQSQRQDHLSGLAKQIEGVSCSLTSGDDQIVLTMGRNQKALISMELATRDDPKQLEIRLVEKLPGPMSILRGSSWDEKLGQLETLEKKMEDQFNVLNEKLGSVQKHLEVQLQNPLPVLEAQIIQLRNQLSSIDEKVSQEGEKKLKTIESMRFANRDELKVQEWKHLLEKKEISHLEKKLEQLMNTERRMEEQFKAEMKTRLRETKMLLHEKLGSAQTHLEAQQQNPLTCLEIQIKQLTNQLFFIDQKVSQKIEKKLQTIHSMQFTNRDELKQWKDLLEKKLSSSQPTLEISHLEKKLEQIEKSEKKMGEQLKAEIKNSLGATEMLLDEKLGSVQTQLEARLQNPLSGLETQIKQLTNQLSSSDQKVSQEIEKKLQTIHSMQFASTDELKQWKDLLEKKLSTSQPTLEISHLEEKLEQLEKSDTEKHFEAELEKLRTEIDWRRARNNADYIILDVGTAHPNLSISGDKKNLKHEAQPQKVSPKPERFDSTVCVLGSEEFSSGKHYWEVDVGSSTDWDLGVARKSIKRKGKLSLSPKEGFWALGVSRKDYWAKTDPWTRVLVQKKPKKIGVYLSYQDGQVTFFNVTDMSVLFTFNDCSFSGAVYPFFKNSHKETIMRICSIKED
ncbi:coiled-coil domain-containing protein 136 [Platysternon megacephalum]|uniref:Coiled-coil domain-containing protein 136 n=1 Tax=Platysternon megacephalum TaxID=55544 RepID=A0A4D9DTA6_9SAUR|nr:coiled-coil domain-containing protein 136 [Platysternon megacephalum]